MNPREQAFVLWAIKYTAIYFLIALLSGLICCLTDTIWPMLCLLPFHFLGMIQNFVAFGLTVNDLYWRPFPKLYWKWIWLFVFSYTGGIGWLVYVFRHALKPRPAA